MLIDCLHAIIAVVVKGTLELNFKLMVGTCCKREQYEVTLKLHLNNAARILHQFLHFMNNPTVVIQLIMLRESLILLLFNKDPQVVAELGHSLPQFFLGPRVCPKIGELIRKLVEAVDEVLD